MADCLTLLNAYHQQPPAHSLLSLERVPGTLRALCTASFFTDDVLPQVMYTPFSILCHVNPGSVNSVPLSREFLGAEGYVTLSSAGATNASKFKSA